MKSLDNDLGIQSVVLGITSNGVQRQSKMEMFGEALGGKHNASLALVGLVIEKRDNLRLNVM